jgi:biopolymer transport protein ExbD
MPALAPTSAADGSASSSEDFPCAISMMSTTDGVWISTDAGACRAPRVDGAHDLAWVEAELKQLRASYATCSTAVEAYADGGTYQDLISLMDVAVKVGFPEFGLADRSELRIALGDAHAAPHCTQPTPPPAKPPKPPSPPAMPPLSPDEAEMLLAVSRSLAAELEAQRPLQPSDSRAALQSAPVIIVTKTEVTLKGQLVATIDRVPTQEPQILQPLYEALVKEADAIRAKLASGGYPRDLVQACDDIRRGRRPRPGHRCPDGLAILQADAASDARVITTITRTAKKAGFDNLLFAVKYK